MPRPSKIVLDFIADPDGISTSQSPGAAGNLTITGALASGGTVTLASPHIVEITSAGNDSAKIFTVTGKDYRGEAISEAVTGANAGVAVTTRYFSYISQVSINAASAGAVTVGVNGKASTPWWVVDRLSGQGNVSVNADVTGTVNYDIQFTNQDTLGIAPHEITSLITPTVVGGLSADTHYRPDAHLTAIRVKGNSGSGLIDVYLSQGDLR